MTDVEMRFWSKVRIGDGCWNWIGAIGPRGYGGFKFHGKRQSSHRVALALTGQAMPPSSVDVCHRCDNPKCVRPSHLFIGSRSENLLDASTKGRIARGESHGSSKLSSDDVVDIRRRVSNGETQTSLALAYGVSVTAIHLIHHRLRWAHLPQPRENDSGDGLNMS